MGVIGVVGASGVIGLLGARGESEGVPEGGASGVKLDGGAVRFIPGPVTMERCGPPRKRGGI